MNFDINVFKESKEDMDKFNNLIKEWEKTGNWHEDQDPADPNSYYPLTEDYPYIRKGIKNFFVCSYYMHVLKWAGKKINKELIDLKVVGKENLKGIKGAIVTCNHISKLDSFAVRGAIGYNIKHVASERNNWKGLLGDVSRHTGLIPIPMDLNLKTMRKFNETMEYYLKKGKKILIYPEQAMWREYKKPRHPKEGAYRYASKHNVPILPLFITLEQNKPELDELGRVNYHQYTVHILPPIYPKEDLSFKENIAYLKNANYEAWKECYENTYGQKLEYTTDPSLLKI